MKEGLNIDQAENLRRLIERRARGIDVSFHSTIENLFSGRKNVCVFVGRPEEEISFCALIANLALELSREGRRILLLDGHASSMNPSVMMGNPLSCSLKEFGSGECLLSDAVGLWNRRLRYLRGLDAIESIHEWETQRRLEFFQEMERILSEEIDTVMINEVDLRFSKIEKNVVMVFSPADESIISTYKRMKAILDANPDARFFCVANNAFSARVASAAAQRLSVAVKKFLSVEIEYLGGLILTPQVMRSMQEKKAFVVSHMYSKASAHLREIAQRFRKVLSRSEQEQKEVLS
jgi:flagellar biosynthesis protein FlhG